jgi:HSP20 family protein
MAEKKAREESGTLAPWHPFGELEPWPSFFERPFGRFPRFMEELFREWAPAGRGRTLMPAMDICDDDQRYTISVELPGTKKEDVQVELQEGVLTIRGEKKSEREEKKEKRRYVERTYGSFTRSFTLPRDADGERLDASFKDGVLTITIPKAEEAKPRSITIK